MSAQNPCRIILVRHGQTEWNRVERFRGQVDIPLNETGLDQAAATGLRIAQEWQPSAIYSSPLSRAVETAQAIAQHHNLTTHICSDLTDIHYGKWQGLTLDEVQKRWSEALHGWYNSPHTAVIPDGETLVDLRRRAMKTVCELSDSHCGDTIVLVGHTVINRMILLGVLGLGIERFWHLRQDTCAINIFEVEQDDFILVSLNDNCHLRSKSTDRN